ncbi:MAG TPA: hypothetical protein VK760_16675 [Candidatus Acidoferrales bacterium]|jgi:virginiamycin B lyase|nr:hypothetical protein [Candidatus Acidoferrales bacterium]
MLRRFLTVLVLSLLAACAGAGGSQAPLPAGVAARTNEATSKLTLRIAIPRRQPNERRSKYISPATQAIEIKLSGPTTIALLVAGLTPKSKGCSGTFPSTSCIVTVPGLKPCPKPADCYSATFATYDAYDARDNTIPVNAHKLSEARDVPFHIAVGRHNELAIALGGIPAGVSFVPAAGSTFTGDAASGYALAKCSSPPQDVNVYGVDADGHYILGAGAPSLALASNDAADLPVTATPLPSAQNRFTLTPAALPNGNAIVRLTATVTPHAKTGAPAKKLDVNVTFGGTICGVFTEYPVPTSSGGPLGIAAGPDGALWFTENGGDKIGRITTAGVITETAIPTHASTPGEITTGPDGALWFTEGFGNKIGRITTGGVITETTIPTGGSSPYGITPGPDGALWFTETNGNKIGRITTSGTIAETTIPTPGSFPFGITVGPDGALWFGEAFGNKVCRITTGAAIAEYTVPTSNGQPSVITSGPDGALWFTENGGNKIGRITTEGAITESPVPTAGAQPYFIMAGPDGALWFDEFTGNKIARITTTGITEIAIPTGSSLPAGMALGPDGALWFAEANGNKIGRLR